MENQEIILLDHGSGGKLSRRLLENELLPLLKNPFLAPLGDSALLQIPEGNIAFTTDSFVVSPRFFPGGDLGELAVCGTCNDLAVMGAQPKYLSLGLILEEGFPIPEMRKILGSLNHTAQKAGVQIVTGDTKVVEKGAADGIFINTAGIGILSAYRPQPLEPGDKVIVSGTIGDHGACILCAREQLINQQILSDCDLIYPLVKPITAEYSPSLKFMRDPTRGGLAGVLNELVKDSGLGLEIRETELPVNPKVASLCEILGLSPYYLACEGRLVLAAKARESENILQLLKKTPGGEHSAIIGEAKTAYPGKVVLKTSLGTSRLLEELVGEPLPRIC